MKENKITKKINKYNEVPVLGSLLQYVKTNAGILVAFLTLFVLLAIFADNFLTSDNLLNVLRTVSTNVLLAIGVMMALMLGGIDLTGGALVALASCASVILIDKFSIPIVLAMFISVLVGTIVGAINGAIIAYSGIHPFIVTLAMMNICRGFSYLVCNGQPWTLYGYDEFSKFGNGNLAGIPYPIFYMIFFLICTYILLNKTRAGRHIYAVGGNPIAAKYSGINIKKINIMVWSISGTLAAFAGIVLASRMTSGQPSLGVGYETDAIAASVVGGVSMYGGQGSVGGMIIGALIIGLISNGLNLLHVNSYWQYVVKGVIILLAVYIDMMRKRNRNNS